MVFTATHNSSHSVVALKALPEDSNEFKLFSLFCRAGGTGATADPELRIVPVIALIPPFAVYEGRTMRAVCMPMLTSLVGAIAGGKLPCSNAVLVDIATQLLQVVVD